MNPPQRKVVALLLMLLPSLGLGLTPLGGGSASVWVLLALVAAGMALAAAGP